MVAETRARRRRLLGALLVGLVALAPLALGTVHHLSRGVVFTGCALALAAALWERRAAGKRIAVTVPMVALAIAVAATAAQLVPLPAALLARLSPAAHDLLSLRPYAYHALSLEPAGTAAELAKLAAYLAFFGAAGIYASRSHRRRHLVLAVAGVATLVALIGLAQAALGVKKILGVYTPDAEWAPLVRGTFVNPNHFGALLGLGAPCALILALRERRLRLAAFVAVFLIDVAVILTVQRAAVVAAFLGQALVFAIDRLQLWRGRDFLQSRALVRGTLALAIVAAVAVAVGFGRDRLQVEATRTAELEDLRDPLSKLRVWQRSGEVVWSYPWTGIGRGAFPQVFTRYSEVGGYTRYEWAENGYVQATVDWGVPVVLILLLLGGWAAVLAARRLGDDPLALGAFAGLTALAVHDAADFSIELPGVALPALALVATLFGRRATGPAAGQRLYGVRAAFLAAPALLLAPFVLELRMPSADEDAAALTTAARDPRVPAQALVARGDAARARHPADYYLCTLVAERLARELRPESLRWLNEAMYLNPTHPAPHLMAAEVLAVAGRKSQALVEYRLAAAGAPEPRAAVWERVLARYPALEDLLAATPDDAARLHILAKWLYAKGRGADAERLYQMVLEREPAHPQALAALARIALQRRDAGAAAERVQALLAVDRGPEARRFSVAERLLAGDLAAAAALADRWLEPSDDAFPLEVELAAALVGAGRVDDARRRLDRVASWDLDQAQRIALHESRAALEHAAGNEHQYRWEMEQRDLLRGK